MINVLLNFSIDSIFNDVHNKTQDKQSKYTYTTTYLSYLSYIFQIKFTKISHQYSCTFKIPPLELIYINYKIRNCTI